MVGATGQNQAFGGELANAGSMPVPPGMSADNIINTEIEEYNKAAGIDTQTNQVFDTSNEKEAKKYEVAKKAQDRKMYYEGGIVQYKDIKDKVKKCDAKVGLNTMK